MRTPTTFGLAVFFCGALGSTVAGAQPARTDQAVTRGELAKFLANALGLQGQ